MDNFESILTFLFIIFVLYIANRINRGRIKSRRERLIDEYTFPKSIEEKIVEKYPHLKASEVKEVMHALRDYFHVCNIAGKRMVAMPSQVVDLAWHEFILFTQQYDKFCKKAFGRFLHHTPAEAMSSQVIAQNGIKTAWRIACIRQHISPKSPTILPPLFAIDNKLNIPNGFKYSLNCKGKGNQSYCATHIGCTSSCGSGAGIGCAGGPGSSCSSGDSGGGCGGGGCGGS